MPVSAVLASDEVILTLRPGEHGSTYGGNPLACKVATAALEVLRDEKLSENAVARGAQLRNGLSQFVGKTCIEKVRGRGLLNAMIIDQPKGKYSDNGKAWDLCLVMKDHGLLAKPTHGNSKLQFFTERVPRYLETLTFLSCVYRSNPLRAPFDHYGGPS